MVWGSFLIAAAALKTPTRNGDNAQGVNLTFDLTAVRSVICVSPVHTGTQPVGDGRARET